MAMTGKTQRLVVSVVAAVVAVLSAHAASGAFVSPIGVTDPGSYGVFGVGTLQADPNLYANATSTAYVAPDQLSIPDATWLDDSTAALPNGDQFDITLDQNYDLTRFYFWNYRIFNGLYSVSTFSLATSSTPAGEDFGAASIFTADNGAGSAASNGVVDEHAFSSNDAKRVRFTILTSVSPNNLVGINEFAFAGTPVSGPSTPDLPTVENPSFEIPGGAGDNLNPSALAGWTSDYLAPVPVFNPDDLDFAGATDGDATPSTLPDGDFVGFTWANHYLKQTLTTAVVPNAQYTLSFFVGDSGQFIFPTANGGYGVSLTTTDDQTIIDELGSSLTTPADGQFEFIQLNGTAPADSSGNLVVQFVDLSGTAELAFFDQVSVTLSEVPEPGTFAMAVSGLLGAFCLFRRRRRKLGQAGNR